MSKTDRTTATHAIARAGAIFLFVAALIPQIGFARNVYKCISAQGAASLQDAPCTKGQRETVIDVGETPAAVESSATSISAASSASAPPVPVSTPAAPDSAPTSVPPAMWLCTRPEDGTRYVSRTDATPSRLVPTAMLGLPGKSLAQAYGPGGGAGVSAPELSKLPSVPVGGKNAAPEGYTEVHDDCSLMEAEQICTYLRGELDAIDQKLPRAFNDEREKLETQRAQLAGDYQACR